MLASITIMQYNNTKITYNINLCDLHNYLKKCSNEIVNFLYG